MGNIFTEQLQKKLTSNKNKKTTLLLIQKSTSLIEQIKTGHIVVIIQKDNCIGSPGIRLLLPTLNMAAVK